MNIIRMKELLEKTTTKGRKLLQPSTSMDIEGTGSRLSVSHYLPFPHYSELKDDNTTIVDCGLIAVAVDTDILKQEKETFITLIDDYPEKDRLKSGLHFLEVGLLLGDPLDALCMFAVGYLLEMWELEFLRDITEKDMMSPSHYIVRGGGIYISSYEARE